MTSSILTIVTLENDYLYARQIHADAASGDLVFAGTPTNRQIWRTADETLGAPDCGSYEGFEVAWEKAPELRAGQWICDQCGAVCDDNDGYAAVEREYWCESCAAKAGIELDNRP